MAKKGGFPNMGGMGNMMKKVQQMQRQIEETQSKLDETEVTITSGGGMIEATVNGKKELIKLKINPDVVEKDDVEMLEDLIIAAVNEAVKKAEKLSTEEMNKITGGIKLPGM